jgi:effector-binding domain-containing protein
MADMHIGALFDRYIPAIFSMLAEHGHDGGAPYGRYHMFGPDTVDIEIGVPTDGPTIELSALSGVESGAIGRSELPGGLTAIVTHRGPYDTLGQSYDILHDWIHTQGHDEGDGPWELYVDSPDKVDDPARIRTEIYWPVL